MKSLLCEAVGAAVLLTLASAPGVSAGVVMNETSVAKGTDGVISSQDKTVYVQGNKRKVDMGHVAEITDLDKGIIYIINKPDRVYAEISMETIHSSEPGSAEDSVTLKKTGGTRVIANHPCNEYRTVEGNNQEHVTISACVSDNTPGAKELSLFADKMVARLHDRGFEHSAEHETAGLTLDKQSVLSFRVPNFSRGKAYRTASLIAETRVNKIEVQRLPDDTFKPPEGYSKLHKPLPWMAPAEPPDSNQAFQAIALRRPELSRSAT
jgi:Domain of unknown function (DUF4412)